MDFIGSLSKKFSFPLVTHFLRTKFEKHLKSRLVVEKDENWRVHMSLRIKHCSSNRY